MTIIDDNVSEQIENFHVQLVADSPLISSLTVDLLPNNATVYIVDDDGMHYYNIIMLCTFTYRIAGNF